MKIKTLKELRENKKLTQEEASKKFEITKEYLSMLERGERNPSDKLKEKMASEYKVSISYIFLATNKTKCFEKIKAKTKCS